VSFYLYEFVEGSIPMTPTRNHEIVLHVALR